MSPASGPQAPDRCATPMATCGQGKGTPTAVPTWWRDGRQAPGAGDGWSENSSTALYRMRRSDLEAVLRSQEVVTLSDCLSSLDFADSLCIADSALRHEDTGRHGLIEIADAGAAPEIGWPGAWLGTHPEGGQSVRVHTPCDVASGPGLDLRPQMECSMRAGSAGRTSSTRCSESLSRLNHARFIPAPAT